MSNMIIFVLIGAVCLFVVTGGFLSMTDTEVSPTYLAAGAALGGVAGGLLGPSIGGSVGSESSVSGGGVSSISDGLSNASKLLSAFTGSSGAPEMKVGLPAF
jgi:hypothetical protein